VLTTYQSIQAGTAGNQEVTCTTDLVLKSAWSPATHEPIVGVNTDVSEWRKKVAKFLDVLGAVLLCGLAVVIFFIAQATTESNAVTTEVALLQAKEESRLVKEMRLLTLEVKNLQKDIDVIRDGLEIKKEKK
jgi:hypothetical protein